MRVICTSVGRGRDSQPGTLRVSFEEEQPPRATVLTYTISVADAGKFMVGSVYNIAEPTLALISEVPPDDAPVRDGEGEV